MRAKTVSERILMVKYIYAMWWTDDVEASRARVTEGQKAVLGKCALCGGDTKGPSNWHLLAACQDHRAKKCRVQILDRVTEALDKVVTDTGVKSWLRTPWALDAEGRLLQMGTVEQLLQCYGSKDEREIEGLRQLSAVLRVGDRCGGDQRRLAFRGMLGKGWRTLMQKWGVTAAQADAVVKGIFKEATRGGVDMGRMYQKVVREQREKMSKLTDEGEMHGSEARRYIEQAKEKTRHESKQEIDFSWMRSMNWRRQLVWAAKKLDEPKVHNWLQKYSLRRPRKRAAGQTEKQVDKRQRQLQTRGELRLRDASSGGDTTLKSRDRGQEAGGTAVRADRNREKEQYVAPEDYGRESREDVAERGTGEEAREELGGASAQRGENGAGQGQDVDSRQTDRAEAIGGWQKDVEMAEQTQGVRSRSGSVDLGLGAAAAEAVDSGSESGEDVGRRNQKGGVARRCGRGAYVVKSDSSSRSGGEEGARERRGIQDGDADESKVCKFLRVDAQSGRGHSGGRGQERDNEGIAVGVGQEQRSVGGGARRKRREGGLRDSVGELEADEVVGEGSTAMRGKRHRWDTGDGTRNSGRRVGRAGRQGGGEWRAEVLDTLVCRMVQSDEGGSEEEGIEGGVSRCGHEDKGSSEDGSDKGITKVDATRAGSADWCEIDADGARLGRCSVHNIHDVRLEQQEKEQEDGRDALLELQGAQGEEERSTLARDGGNQRDGGEEARQAYSDGALDVVQAQRVLGDGESVGRTSGEAAHEGNEKGAVPGGLLPILELSGENEGMESYEADSYMDLQEIRRRAVAGEAVQSRVQLRGVESEDKWAEAVEAQGESAAGEDEGGTDGDFRGGIQVSDATGTGDRLDGVGGEIGVGEAVEALFQGQWQAGTLIGRIQGVDVDAPDAKWMVQGAADKYGIITYTPQIRRRQSEAVPKRIEAEWIGRRGRLMKRTARQRGMEDDKGEALQKYKRQRENREVRVDVEAEVRRRVKRLRPADRAGVAKRGREGMELRVANGEGQEVKRQTGAARDHELRSWSRPAGVVQLEKRRREGVELRVASGEGQEVKRRPGADRDHELRSWSRPAGVRRGRKRNRVQQKMKEMVWREEMRMESRKRQWEQDVEAESRYMMEEEQKQRGRMQHERG